MTNKKIIFLTIFFLGLFGLVKNSHAAGTTYYVCDTVSACNAGGGSGWSGTPSDSNNGTSKATAFKTISQGARAMSGGDTLLIGNGTYNNDSNYKNEIWWNDTPYVHLPSGTADQYTIVQAEVDGGVTIMGPYHNGYAISIIGLASQQVAPGDPGASWDSSPYQQSYIMVRGINMGGGSAVYITAADHIKIINCGGFDANNGNTTNFASSQSQYVLFEGCYAYGGGRAKFLFFHNQYSIGRNLVARNDYVNTVDPNPVSTFDNYSSMNIEWQNCIAVDSDQPANYHTYGGADNGSLCAATTSGTSMTSGPINFTNCLVLNSAIRFLETDGLAYKPETNFTNCAGWHVFGSQWGEIDDRTSALVISQGPNVINHVTMGDMTKINGADGSNEYISSWAHYPPGFQSAINNSIIYNFTGANTDYLFQGGAGSYWTSDHTNLYGFGGSSVNITMDNSISSNPRSNGLLYLPRIETNGSLNSAGASGTYVGANIVYQYGKSGTYWGDAGYNMLQDGTNGQGTVKLWPWGKTTGSASFDEDIIKAKFAAYNNHSINGARGFAAAGNDQWGQPLTLTRYIWQYLGNKIPDDIYGGSSGGDTTAPAAPSGLAVQ